MKYIAFHPYIYMIVHSCKTKYFDHILWNTDCIWNVSIYSICYTISHWKCFFQYVNLLYIYLKSVLKIIKAQIIKNLLLIYLMTSGMNKTMTAFKVLQSFWYNFHNNIDKKKIVVSWSLYSFFFLSWRKIFKDFSSAQDLRESESIDVDNKSDILSTECWVEDDIGIHNKTTKDWNWNYYFKVSDLSGRVKFEQSLLKVYKWLKSKCMFIKKC